jgi:Gametolysin peptidase M11
MQNKVGALRAWTVALACVACAPLAATAAPAIRRAMHAIVASAIQRVSRSLRAPGIRQIACAGFMAAGGVTAPLVAYAQGSHGAATAIEGTLEVLVEDHADHRLSRTRHFLKAGSERVELKFAGRGKAPELRSGAKIRVQGTKSDNTLYLNLDGSSGGVTTLAAAPAPSAMGEQRTAVILVNFQDKPADKPWTTDQVRSMVFGTVNNFYLENSFQQAWLSGDVVGWYTIPQVSTTCDQLQIASHAKAAAGAAGVSVSSYARLVYVFPKNPACYWSGTASVSGTPSQTWINGELTLDILAHEIGHNFGLHHSHASICNGSTLGDNCMQSEYGDTVDMMGGARSAHFNAFQKEYLGWLNGSATPPIQTVSASGNFTIDRYVGSGTNAKALKILKSTDPLTGKKTYYYVEYRQALGFDAPLGDSSSMLLSAANVMNGVLIRTGSADESGNTSFLLDMTPATYDNFYPRDPALVVGGTFTDIGAGVTISAAWADGTSAGVTVALKPSGCVRANPLVAVSPASQQAAPGGAVVYAVTLTNNDAASCGASTFDLQGSLPAGWAGSFASASLSAAAGASASTTLTVASPVTAGASSYSIGISAANAASNTNSGAASATYTVASTASASTLVTIVTDKPGYALGQTATMTTTVKSGGIPVNAATVSFTVTKPTGAVVTQTAVTNASGVAVSKYRIGRKDPPGLYRAAASGGAGGSSGSGSTSFSVQ